FVVGQHVPATLRPFEDATDRLHQVEHGDLVPLAADGEKRGLVDDVGQVGTGEARSALGDVVEADVGGERLAAAVDLEDALAAVEVRALDRDVPVEPAGPA